MPQLRNERRAAMVARYMAKSDEELLAARGELIADKSGWEGVMRALPNSTEKPQLYRAKRLSAEIGIAQVVQELRLVNRLLNIGFVKAPDGFAPDREKALAKWENGEKCIGVSEYTRRARFNLLRLCVERALDLIEDVEQDDEIREFIGAAHRTLAMCKWPIYKEPVPCLGGNERLNDANTDTIE